MIRVQFSHWEVENGKINLEEYEFLEVKFLNFSKKSNYIAKEWRKKNHSNPS
jgi:hypothetical protein